MNTDSLSFALNEVINLINSLNKKQYKYQLSQLKKLSSQFGIECDRQIYRHLLLVITSTTDQQRLALLHQLFSDLDFFSKPNWTTLVESSLKSLSSINVLELSKCLRLTDAQKTLLLVAFSEQTKLGNCDRLKELHIDINQRSESTHYLLTQTSLDNKDLFEKLKKDLNLTTESIESKNSLLHLPFTCKTIELPKMDLSTVGSLSDSQIAEMLVNESGCPITADMLRQFNVTPKLCAKILLAICESNSNVKSEAGQPQRSEEIDNFANVCREILSSASPLTEVIQVIDDEAFINNSNRIFSPKLFSKNNTINVFQKFWQFCVNLCTTDKQGLHVLASAFFGKLWKSNIEFQFGFIVNCIKNQLILKLLSSSSGGDGAIEQTVYHLENLKSQPDFEGTPELNTWKYQRLYQVLMEISSMNYQAAINTNPTLSNSSGTLFYSQMIEIFKWPLQHCPDLVALGLLGCNNVNSVVKNEILLLSIPAFLGNHPNGTSILHAIWNTNENQPTNTNANHWAKQVLLQAMCEYYMKSNQEEQQSKLSRILDVAQDLKALSLLLNGNTYPFVIDLACLASRREYLKLDKWLMDKIESNGENFVSACIMFLNRRCGSIFGNPSTNESSTTLMSHETLATMLSCLQQILPPTPGSNSTINVSISQELSETILTMVANSSRFLSKVPRQSAPGVIPNLVNSRTMNSNAQLPLADLGLNSLSLNATSLHHSENTPSLPSPLLSQFNSRTSINNLTNNQLNPPPNSSIVMTPPSQRGQPSNDLANIFPELHQNVSVDIEEEADSYFQRIYNRSTNNLSVDEVLEMLRKFQDSPDKRQREVFSCMIKNLFKEYNFFTQYPETELMITAQLFGGIIQMGLVKYMALVVALRYVLEALRKPLNSKMYFFGIHALEKFKTKLKDYPLYCQHLASIPHFSSFPPDLIEYIEYGAQSQEPSQQKLGLTPGHQSMIDMNTSPNMNNLIGTNHPMASLPAVNFANNQNAASQSVIGMPNQTVTRPIQTTNSSITSSVSAITSTNTNSRPSIANATNIDTLLAAGDTMYQAPPESLQDKVAFIINNLSQVNLSQKTEEFKDVLGKDDQYMGWIAQYFVMKRASIEPNFHTLYANFLEMLKNNDLINLILKETHRNIKVLLRSDKELANFSDRSLLKNLGHWLGMLTIGKNKPILAIDLELKNLLIEAYHKGTQELLYVVPFIAKILESCSKSKIFKPRNPWIMGILKVLVELHQLPNLKLNLKFEVEVLFKQLSLELNEYINDFGNLNTLKDEEIYSKIEHQLGGGAPTVVKSGQQTISNEQLMAPHASPPIMPFGQSHMAISIPSSSSSSSPGVQLFNYHDINVSSPAGLAQHIAIQPNLQLLNMNPVLKQFVRPAIERAVSEWLQPVIERSLKISLTTVEQIIKKDFALDPDENKMIAAAHYLLRNLLSGMSMITCKDPLLLSITTTLKAAFTSKCPNVNKELIELTANAIAQDNIDAACCFIQKTAIEKSMPELERKLKNEIELRRNARAEGRRYFDSSVLAYQMERMPEPIRLKVGPVTQQQMNIYEELGRNIPGFISPVNMSSSGANAMTNASGVSQMVSVQVPSSLMNQFKNANSLTPSSTGIAGGFSVNTEALMSSQIVPQEPHLIQTMYEKIMAELEQHLVAIHQTYPTPIIETGKTILENLMMARNNPTQMSFASSLITKSINAISELIILDNGIIDSPTLRLREIYFIILKALADQRAFTHAWTSKQITKTYLEKINAVNLPDDLFDQLIRSGLFSFAFMDTQLASLIEVGSTQALNFCFQFAKVYPHHCNESDFPHIVESLGKLAKQLASSNLPLANEIQQMIDSFRAHSSHVMPSDPSMLMQSTQFNQSREFDADPPGLLEKTERLLREWIQLYHSTTNTTKIFQFYVQQMNLQGILKTDDLITRFFRLSTEMCVELCYRILNNPQGGNIIEVRTKCFHTLDAFTHLIVMLVKHSGSSSAQTGAASETTAKLNLLNKVLTIIAGVANQDQDLRQGEFQHLPYYRIFALLFMELVLGPNNLGLTGSVLLQHNQLGMALTPSQMDPIVENVQYQVLNAFCSTLHMLRPSKAPSFTFAWLDFISHRTFLEKCLYSGVSNPGAPTKGWQMYAQLLIDLLKFEAPFIRNVDLAQSMDILYKGTLKVFLVLLHDFPEFLCEYCYSLCDVIPCNAIQMRNLVLSAFPRNMRLPDPFTPNLRIDNLSDITQPAKGSATFAVLNSQTWKKDLDSYLRTRSPVTFLSDLRGYLQSNPNQTNDSTHYNVPLINALVLYVGQTAIQTISPKNINISSISHSSHMDIFQNLAVALDTEGRYLFLNAIANQLRYPNSHTHYFSCTLLYLFAESNTEATQEQITRVLLERLIVNRPHPWGLLVTFIDLIKNPSFKFWNHDFVRCAPEIEKLFESVARSCNNTNYKGTPNSGPSDSVLPSQANQNA